MTWTRRQNQALLELIIADPRRAIGRFSRTHRIPRAEVKRHMRAIGLVVVDGPRPRTCRHRTPLIVTSVCADCAEERSL